MHEILKNLPDRSFVLDLGCFHGSFARESTRAVTIRLDREMAARSEGEIVVQGDAACLAFADRSFAAIIANHSLEHFDDLESALKEIGRVIGPGGALFVSVPDSSTLTDKLYRWLARGGGHVNPFVSPEELAGRIEQVTGLRHVTTRTLCSSLSFLNRRNAPSPRPRRLLLLGGGFEWSLFLYAWFSRRIDRFLGARTSVYGWAFYFGNIPVPVGAATDWNVCLRCGSGSSASLLKQQSLTRSRLGIFQTYTCPCCGALNPFIDDQS